LVMVGRRRHRMESYFLGGVCGVPVAVISASLFTGAFISLFGHSLQKDITISSVGAGLFIAVSITLHRCYMRKKVDDNSVEEGNSSDATIEPFAAANRWSFRCFAQDYKNTSIPIHAR